MTENKTEALSSDVLAWVERAIGRDARVCSVRCAKGATSSSVYFINLTSNGHSHNCILRLFTNEDWLQQEPDLVEHEAAVLIKAQEVALPTPELIAYSSENSERGTPIILMSFIEGEIELRPKDFGSWLTQLAEGVAKIHSISADDFGWEYFSWTEMNDLQPPVWSKHPELWEQAIEIGLKGPPDYEQAFIHRDYHPTNVLWSSGKLCGIVDWVNGCQGPVSVDLAHCRRNLVAMYGSKIAEEFLVAYKQVIGSGFIHHPYWDIDSILGILPEPGYYLPWMDFGLGRIKQETLRARQDEYLKTIMDRI